MSYRIGSLNMLRSRRTEEQLRDFRELIYRLVRDKGLDIVAFQEDEADKSAVLNDVQKWLPHWECSRPASSEFAFIWNPRRVKECSKDMEPQVFTAYKSNVHLTREPLYGRFEPVGIGPFVEFRLVNIHLHYGKNKASNDDEPEAEKDIVRRQRECDAAKGVIHDTIDKHRYGNFNRAFTIVLGDYNFDCETCNRFGSLNVRTIQAEKTTLKKKEPYGYKNSYDHFSFDVKKNSSVPYTETRVDAVNEYFNGDFSRYRRNISDHVPIIIEIF